MINSDFSSFVLKECDISFAVGKYKTQVVNACRSAIKANNVSSLFKIIKTAAT